MNIVSEDGFRQETVKFVWTYAWTVHPRCAAWGISPSLWGFNDAVPGGWHIVIVDLLEEYQCLHDVKHSLSPEEKEKLGEGLRSKPP